ncbi:MAG TPA: MopE-related protein [Parafilimonas sp.]|nr:MopE-related protein [Parafilimonas sp.]
MKPIYLSKKLLPCIFCLVSLSAYSKIIYIKSTAAGANNGTSWANAFKGFQAGIDAAAVGDVVFVAAGTYQPASSQSFTMKEGVKIYGGFAGTETALEQRNWKTNTTVLKGNNASVVYNHYTGLTSAAVLDGFTITGGNTNYGDGGGMHNYYTSPTINNCIFYSNHAKDGDGGGMYNYYASPTINNCIFYSNYADWDGGGMYNINSSPIVQNCLFYGNSADLSGAEITNASGNGNFINVTVVSNVANAFVANGYTSLYNSIVWGAIEFNYSANNCLIKGSSNTANGNLDATGLTDVAIFNNPVGNDYTLKSGSPCIDKGNNSYVTASPDLIGNYRIFNGIVDMGAYENSLVAPDINGILYVKSTAVPAYSGNSWTSAISSLTDALSTAKNNASVKQIWVAAGTYQPLYKQSFAMVKNVKIYGGFAGTETALEQRNWKTNTTILKGNNNCVIYNFVNDLTPTDVLDGFTITGGNAEEGGGIYNLGASPTINNCIFYNNHALKYGGAMYNSFSYAEVQNTLFYENSSDYEGAEIHHNGGNTYPNFRNVTIISNAATAVRADAGHIFLYNSIVWAPIYGTGYSASNCLIKGSSSTANSNLDATGLTDAAVFNNPVGNDYTLKPGSPSINKGNNSYVSGTTDLNGNNRILHGIVDIGAYESTALPVTATLQADTTICQQTYTLVTFIGAGGVAPYTFGYSVNGGLAQIITTQTGDTVSIVVPSATSSIVTYTLVSVSDNTDNTAMVDSTISISIQPLHTYYQDADGDGFGDTGNSIGDCVTTPPPGYVTDNTDCNDADAAIHAPVVFYKDNDGDGFGDAGNTTSACSLIPPAGYVANNTDCDDTKLLYADNDSDGFGAGPSVACGVANSTDSNDADNTKWQSATLYIDADGDGYDAGTATVCYGAPVPTGYTVTTNGSDCNDTNAAVNPGATEICGNGIDDNCNGSIDEGAITWYQDKDKDGYGNPAVSVVACSKPAGYVNNSGDCNDKKSWISPGATEICGNGVDDNCNGQVDEIIISNLSTTNITAYSARLSWSSSVIPLLFQVEYKRTTSTIWIPVVLPGISNSLPVLLLSSNQNYQWRIKALCGSKWTGYSPVQTFKTTSYSFASGDGKDLLQAKEINSVPAGINIFPNPTSGRFTIELNTTGSKETAASIQILNANGKTMHTEKGKLLAGKLKQAITMPAGMPQGLYLVRVAVNDKIYTARLLYQK